MSNVISFKDVSLNFGGVQALKNISFDIQENSLFAIIGQNGAGKTSILNCINGIYKPTSGSIEIFGEDTSNLEPDEIANAGVSRTFQNIELFENMTALDNILIGAHRHINYGPVQGLFFSKKARNEEEKARKIAEDVIDFLEIEEYRYSYILSLPYGIQKRIELGRALAMQPKVILLDEPSLGLAPKLVEQISELIVEINSQGVTVLLVEQNANMALKISSHGYIMETGNIVMDNPSEKLLQDKDVQEFYLGLNAEGTERKSFKDVKHYKRKKRWLS